MTTRDQLEEAWSIRAAGLADDLGDFLRAWAVANGVPDLGEEALAVAHQSIVGAVITTVAELASFGFDDDAKAEAAMLDLYRATRDECRELAREGMN
jgi:hypothetical protein